SLSIGSAGSIRFRIPSKPAISCAAKPKYGLPEGSGARNSRRLAFGLEPVTGMRTAAERLPCESSILTGASKPLTRRLYEFTVGLVKASTAEACLSRPPIYQRAVSDRLA